MKKEIKEKWITALRSGEYQQGTGRLKGLDGKYCCLGVLANICGVTWEEDGNSYSAHIDGEIVGLGMLSHKFHKLIGTINQHSFIKMNDSGESFNGIASYIERNIIAE